MNTKSEETVSMVRTTLTTLYNYKKTLNLTVLGISLDVHMMYVSVSTNGLSQVMLGRKYINWDTI